MRTKRCTYDGMQFTVLVAGLGLPVAKISSLNGTEFLTVSKTRMGRG